MTGWVADLVPYLNRSRLSIAPLRYGAGVKGKVLTSMSHGLPVVLSSPAAEGIPVVDGRDALVADDPVDFRDRIVELYRDEQLWSELSANGLALVARRFSLTTARRQLRHLFGQLGLPVTTGKGAQSRSIDTPIPAS